MDEGFFCRLGSRVRPSGSIGPGRAEVAMSIAGNTPSAAYLAEQMRLVATARDRTAFARLFDHFAPRVKSYLMRLGAPAPLADDLAQETMLTVWRKAERFDPSRAGVATWIFTIARNLRIDALRRERVVEAPDTGPGADEPADEPGADSLIAAAEAECLLQAALAALPEDQIRLIRMSFFEDYPHSDIGRRLNMPLGTVKSKLRRTLAALRTALDKHR